MPDWDQGLPLDVLALVAGGSNLLKAMREVSKTWQKGFDYSVTKLRVGPEGPLLPLGGGVFCERFYAVTLLNLERSLIAEADLAHLAGLNRLRILQLGNPVGLNRNLNVLSHRLTANGLRLIRGLQLNWLCLGCSLLRDRDLRKLKELPLTALELSWCGKLTGEGLKYLEGMPLISLRLDTFKQLVDCEVLRSLPLTRLQLAQWPNLESLKPLLGKPLNVLNLDDCPRIHDGNLERLRGMPLKRLGLSGCQLVGQGLRVLKGAPLRYLCLSRSSLLEDVSLSYLKGLPITYLSLAECSSLTDSGLRYLRGLPLEALNLNGSEWLRGRGLRHLMGMPLTKLELFGCKNMDAFRLWNMSKLAILNLGRCPLVTGDHLWCLQWSPALTTITIPRTSFPSCWDAIVCCFPLRPEILWSD